MTLPKRILYILKYQAPNPYSILFSDLKNRLNCGASQLSQALKRLQNSNYIEKTKHGREIMVHLTRAGDYHLKNHFKQCLRKIQEFMELYQVVKPETKYSKINQLWSN